MVGRDIMFCAQNRKSKFRPKPERIYEVIISFLWKKCIFIKKVNSWRKSVLAQTMGMSPSKKFPLWQHPILSYINIVIYMFIYILVLSLKQKLSPGTSLRMKTSLTRVFSIFIAVKSAWRLWDINGLLGMGPGSRLPGHKPTKTNNMWITGREN